MTFQLRQLRISLAILLLLLLHLECVQRAHAQLVVASASM